MLTWIGWWALALNVTACASYIVLSVLMHRRYRRMFAEQSERWSSRFQATFPAIGFCHMVAMDPEVPEAWRAAAKAAIPEWVTVTQVPLNPTSDTLH